MTYGGSQMILDNWLAQRAETCPDRVALIADGAELTYAELEARGDARRRGGSPRGESAAARPSPWRSRSGLEYVVLLHALMKLGAVAHPLNPRLAPAELDAELERAAAGARRSASPTT